MPPKRKAKFDDTVDNVYEDSSHFVTFETAVLEENVVKEIEIANYNWQVIYKIVRDVDSAKIELFFDFNSRYIFKDKVYAWITVESEEEKIEKKFELNKKRGQKFQVDLLEVGTDEFEEMDIKVICEIGVLHTEYTAEIIGTINADFTDEQRPHYAVFLVEGKTFYVLKQYLASWSKFFNTVFYGDPAENHKNEFKLDDIDSEEFNVLLHIIHPSLIYCIDDSNVLYLLKQASHFEMPSLISMCGSHLSDFGNLPSLGLMERLILSDKHNITHLQIACLKNLHAKPAVEQQSFRDENREKIKILSVNTMSNII